MTVYSEVILIEASHCYERMLLVKFKFNKENRMKANKAKADIKGYSIKIETFLFYVYITASRQWSGGS